MSYDIYLLGKDGNPVSVHPFTGGGIIEINPDTMEEIPRARAQLNVTYNYSRVYDLAVKAAIYEIDRISQEDDTTNPSLLAFAKSHLEGMRENGLMHYITGRTAQEVRGALGMVFAQIFTDHPYEQDYWAPTLGNAAVPLDVITSWCVEHPDGTFSVT